MLQLAVETYKISLSSRMNETRVRSGVATSSARACVLQCLPFSLTKNTIPKPSSLNLSSALRIEFYFSTLIHFAIARELHLRAKRVYVRAREQKIFIHTFMRRPRTLLSKRVSQSQ